MALLTSAGANEKKPCTWGTASRRLQSARKASRFQQVVLLQTGDRMRLELPQREGCEHGAGLAETGSRVELQMRAGPARRVNRTLHARVLTLACVSQSRAKRPAAERSRKGPAGGRRRLDTRW